MANQNLQPRQAQWFEIEIPIRGCRTSLREIREVYLELDALNQQEADRTIASIQKPPEKSDADFAKEMSVLKSAAFKITVSIIGGNDNVTKYGEDATIFLTDDLPQPIQKIYFTNENAYKNQASGNSPPNYFKFWMDFTKPPLFDYNPLLSAPTPNGSNVKLKAVDLTYFRAAQSIIRNKFRRNLWSSPAHETFAYDVGLWLLWAPLILFGVTIYADEWIPNTGPHASFRVAFFIYGIAVGLLSYRLLYGYFKWAYPVNVLTDNNDRATRHRILFAAIVFGLFMSLFGRYVARLIGW